MNGMYNSAAVGGNFQGIELKSDGLCELIEVHSSRNYYILVYKFNEAVNTKYHQKKNWDIYVYRGRGFIIGIVPSLYDNTIEMIVYSSSSNFTVSTDVLSTEIVGMRYSEALTDFHKADSQLINRDHASVLNFYANQHRCLPYGCGTRNAISDIMFIVLVVILIVAVSLIIYFIIYLLRKNNKPKEDIIK